MLFFATGKVLSSSSGQRTIPIPYSLRAFDARIKTFVSPVERTLRDSRLSKQQKADYDGLTHAELIFQDLERLGILGFSQPPRRALDDEHCAFTQYGVSFVKAVSPKSKDPKK